MSNVIADIGIEGHTMSSNEGCTNDICGPDIERLRDEMFVVHRKGFLRICHFSRLVLSLLEDFRKVGIEG